MILRRCLVAALVCLPLYAQKSPITHEQMWRMKRVASPKTSPDGKWIVFSVTEPAYEAKDQTADLWIAAADGSSVPRKLTHTKASESGVSWSTDSKRIAFTAKRDADEDSQVYVLDLDAGGEAQRVTQRAGGASDPKFSPDGKSILFSSTHDPLSAERKQRKYNARVYGGFPIRRWDKWLDEKSPRIFVQPLETGAKERDLIGGSKLAAEPGFDGVSGNSGSDLQPVWAPDGASVIFTATTTRHQSAYASVRMNLYRVSLSGGEPVRITDGKDSYAEPAFSPDGRALYALQERETDQVYSLSRLARFDWPSSGSPKITSSTLDRSVGAFGFSADSKTVYILAEEHGHDKLFTLPSEGGTAKLAFEVKEGGYTSLSTGGSTLAAIFDSSIHPFELVRINPASGHKTLTSFNSEAASLIDWQAPRHFWFTSKKGRKVHSMIFLPPAFDPNKKYPLVVNIHGGPHAMSRDVFHQRWNYHLLASPGYVIITTNYTGSTGFGEAFAQAIQNDPLKTPGEEINQAVEEAIKQFPFIDSTRMAAGGASYGGHMANWLEATTTHYKCLYSHAGLVNLESQWGTSDGIYHRERNNGGPVWEQGPVWREQNPARYAAKFRTPMLLTIGEQDFRVPLNQTLENWSLLQRMKVPSRLVVFPDENHWILKGENNRFFYQELLGWLAKYLGP
ncbi:MAG: S9 family peptidase [Acidimicrobiia bacterium]|nr:S9 family peptidase [Acidimicrobiia bacterium]